VWLVLAGDEPDALLDNYDIDRLQESDENILI